MQEKPKKKIITKVLVKKLKPHPFQQKLGPPSPEHKIRALADDIRENGQLVPIEYVGDYKIICGCDRKRALIMLGEERARCWHREDLEEQGEAAIRRDMIEDNLNRKQLSKLTQARYALRLLEIEKGRPDGKLHDWERRAARDRVGEIIGMSGRNLQRHSGILETPMAVQNAFENGKLTLVAADRVASLSGEVQAEIAQRISDGESAKEVVAAYTGKAQKSRRSAVSDFHRAISNANKALKGHSLSGFAARPLNGEVEELELCQGHIGELLTAYTREETRVKKILTRASTRPRRKRAK